MGCKKGNYKPNDYKIYWSDIGLLIASLDEEAQADFRQNKNFNTYKGAIYENIITDAFVKQGYDLYYYKNEKSTLEMDFFVRDMRGLIPVEVKAGDNATKSLCNLIEKDKYADIHYGIKLCKKNIGFNGKFLFVPFYASVPMIQVLWVFFKRNLQVLWMFYSENIQVLRILRIALI